VIQHANFHSSKFIALIDKNHCLCASFVPFQLAEAKQEAPPTLAVICHQRAP
jgi:hypothetical protein